MLRDLFCKRRSEVKCPEFWSQDKPIKDWNKSSSGGGFMGMIHEHDRQKGILEVILDFPSILSVRLLFSFPALFSVSRHEISSREACFSHVFPRSVSWRRSPWRKRNTMKLVDDSITAWYGTIQRESASRSAQCLNDWESSFSLMFDFMLLSEVREREKDVISKVCYYPCLVSGQLPLFVLLCC